MENTDGVVLTLTCLVTANILTDKHVTKSTLHDKLFQCMETCSAYRITSLQNVEHLK